MKNDKGRDINDVCKLPEFEELRKFILGSQDVFSTWGRVWNNRQKRSCVAFSNKSETVLISADRYKTVEYEPLMVNGYCRSGTKSDTLLNQVIVILRKHNVPFVLN
ncbi:MAG: hypothetical protein UV40_C0030G0003 [Parcubacteria group bacterium GW2011_GWA1_42_7]|nr:MAG: hypothetical protein UV34_C0031G0007 [Parcubacteria group bacterium GW2011_GWB1_42_6]KKS69216.1 MAG: hypothetical protein UV40_C0030G0003 [Parcubacteria group bacterium GW2011_GWA1_42_7]KKS91419.1 MAG: hypothetical protein UV67_C0028G0014 [Parcubacteria group bacterium GW2011_GWC1_43_12]